MFSRALIPKIKGLFAVVALEFHLIFMVSRSCVHFFGTPTTYGLEIYSFVNSY